MPLLPYRPAPVIRNMSNLLGHYGIDGNELLKEAGFEFLIEGTGQEHELTALDMDHFMALLVKRCNDPAFGLLLGSKTTPVSMHALSLSMLSSPTLNDFCSLIAKYQSALIINSSFTFSQASNHASLSIEPPPGIYCPASYRVWVDGVFSYWLNFIRLIYRADYHPKKIACSYQADGDDKLRYEDFFQCPVTFSANNNSFYIQTEDLNIDLPGGNGDLMTLNEQLILKDMRRSDLADIKSAVAVRVIKLLSQERLSKNNVAEDLGVSSRKMEQQLATAGTSYQEVLNNVRTDLARQYLAKSEYSLTHIAYSLGFSDSANFSRAFKLWTDQSPSDYRKKVQQSRQL